MRGSYANAQGKRAGLRKRTSPVRSFACYVGRPVHFETSAEAIFAAGAIRNSSVKELTRTISGCRSDNCGIGHLRIHGSKTTLLGATIALPVSATDLWLSLLRSITALTGL